jgi:hypothetical protein
MWRCNGSGDEQLFLSFRMSPLKLREFLFVFYPQGQILEIITDEDMLQHVLSFAGNNLPINRSKKGTI